VNENSLVLTFVYKLVYPVQLEFNRLSSQASNGMLVIY